MGNDTEAVLIDAGISCRETEKRMKRLGLSMQKVKAVFISHEHADHIHGLPVLSKKYRLPVYITSSTLQFAGLRMESGLVNIFRPGESVYIGQLTIASFSKLHDAADPCSFLISCGGVHVGVFTDIGMPCEALIRHFSLCHAAFLESNYDEAMLNNGGYPYHLKQRIRGGKGHLSNKQALEVFRKYRPSHMSHLLLSHLSKNNNCPKLVKEIFEEHAGGVQVIIASRQEETAVFHVRETMVKKFQPHHEAPTVPQLQFAFA